MNAASPLTPSILNAFFVLLALVALGVLWTAIALKRLSDATRSIDYGKELARDLPPMISGSLHRPLLDLQDRFSRAIGELRESSAEKMQKVQIEASERLERALAQNRTELAQGLVNTTEILNKRFQTLEAGVGERLTKIGENVEAKLNENLKEGFQHFEKVNQHLMQAELKLAELNQVGKSIQDLNSLLKMPHLRGSFGEATLERLLADFLPPGSYEMQYAVVPNSPERVDAVVKLARQVLPIDSKFPREQVLPLFESNDPIVLESARKSLADFMRSEAKDIAKKYIRPEHGTTDLAMIFLPSETLYFEVIRNASLFEELSKLKVYPVSPNTLAMGLHSVSVAQEYYEMSRGVEKTIEDVKKARRHFDHFEKKFEDIGRGLKKAQEAYETANTHLGRYESSVYRLVGASEEGTGRLEENTTPPGADAPNGGTTGSLF
ncbi:MAG: DNA recombination protein RmuC [Cryobacterium sp.]|nr:DNA recombination protein RmuC [Oligoflexia bacterium]